MIVPMDDDELSRIKARKLAEMKRRIEKDEAQKQQEEQYRALIGTRRDQLLKEILAPSGNEYLGRIRTSKPELARTIEDTLILLVSRGRLMGKVDELAIKVLERRIERKEPSITIARRGEDPLTLGNSE